MAIRTSSVSLRKRAMSPAAPTSLPTVSRPMPRSNQLMSFASTVRNRYCRQPRAPCSASTSQAAADAERTRSDPTASASSTYTSVRTLAAKMLAACGAAGSYAANAAKARPTMWVMPTGRPPLITPKSRPGTRRSRQSRREHQRYMARSERRCGVRTTRRGTCAASASRHWRSYFSSRACEGSAEGSGSIGENGRSLATLGALAPFSAGHASRSASKVASFSPRARVSRAGRLAARRDMALSRAPRCTRGHLIQHGLLDAFLCCNDSLFLHRAQSRGQHCEIWYRKSTKNT